MSVYHSAFCVGRTQWVVLSAAATQNRVRNAHGGPKAPNDVIVKLRDGRRGAVMYPAQVTASY